MSDAQGGAPAPGWYEDPTGQAGVRWWDGGQWTAYTGARPADAPTPAAGGRPALPATTPVYTPYIWLVVLLPLLSTATLFLWQPRLRLTTINGTETLDPAAILTPEYFLLVGLGLAVFALTVVFAALDQRALARAGVVRPFPWGWAFLGLVYPIGRSVIVHQVARPRGLLPIWVLVGVFVVNIIVSSIWGAVFSSEIASQLSQLSG